MNSSRIYSIGNLCIRVKCGDRWIAEQIPDLLEPLGFVNGKDILSQPKVNVKFTAFDSHNEKIKLGQSHRLHSFGPLDFFQDNGFLYVTEGKSFVGVDLRSNSGFAFIHDSFWGKPLYFKASLIAIGFILLFWQYNFHELHAAGVANEGKGLLLVGYSGSGKSTLALSLVRQRWHYLSDDMLVLQHTPHGVEALPLRRYFKIAQALITKYPELSHLLNRALDSYKDEKCIYVDEVYANQFTQGCIPRVIIFPRITHEEKSQIKPIKQSEAFINLFKSNGYGMYFSYEIMKHRLEIMRKLVSQANCYQMSVGLDLYEDPEKIQKMLP